MARPRNDGNPQPGASSVTFTHSYNGVNRRTGQQATDNSWWYYPPAMASTVSYTANSLNQYTAVGAVTPAYDGNGNLTSDGTFTCGYDAENRLTAASGTGLSASYAYDAQGRRKLKTVNGTPTVFITDADNREVLEYDGTSGAILNWYAYGLGPNDVLNRMNVAAGTRTTVIPDIQGSILATLDSSTGALTKAGYLPYGESGSTTGSFRYTGQRIDSETNGLYYYRARMYAPAWGRFMQVDPIGFTGGSNLYAYVGNDPLNLKDPTGLTWSDNAWMFAQWVTGTAPANQVFGPDTNQTQDMMNAPGVNSARDFFYQKNSTNSSDQLQSVTNYAVRFGVSGYVQAGTNATQHFVGSYSVDITPNSNGTLTFEVNNTTSMTSFFYGLWPNSLNPSTGYPMGNYRQTYTWTENVNTRLPVSSLSNSSDLSVVGANSSSPLVDVGLGNSSTIPGSGSGK